MNVLVMDPIRNTVSSVTGVRETMSASPCLWKWRRCPSRTTLTARPTAGWRLEIAAGPLPGCPVAACPGGAFTGCPPSGVTGTRAWAAAGLSIVRSETPSP
ncbi:MAG: hypothetical protein ACLQER_19620 [Streptosporangiaceae bacterium]